LALGNLAAPIGFVSGKWFGDGGWIEACMHDQWLLNMALQDEPKTRSKRERDAEPRRRRSRNKVNERKTQHSGKRIQAADWDERHENKLGQQNWGPAHGNQRKIGDEESVGAELGPVPKLKVEKRTSQTTSKNHFLLKFKPDYNSELKRSPPFLPHLITENKNEFLAHSL
jgi:hypothetical protein